MRPALPFDRSTVVRPDGADFTWIVTDGVTAPRRLRSCVWGRPTESDIPVVGEGNGDGRDTPAVMRPDRTSAAAAAADWSAIPLARAYPAASVHGIDLDEASIEQARENAAAPA